MAMILILIMMILVSSFIKLPDDGNDYIRILV